MYTKCLKINKHQSDYSNDACRRGGMAGFLLQACKLVTIFKGGILSYQRSKISGDFSEAVSLPLLSVVSS